MAERVMAVDPVNQQESSSETSTTTMNSQSFMFNSLSMSIG